MDPASTVDDASFRLSPQQVAYFELFGFLKVPGLFSRDIDELARAFEEVFENESTEKMETTETLHFEQKRVIVPRILDQHPRLRALHDDPRVVGIVGTLLGDRYEYAESDGNLFFCDSSWHPDTYGAPMRRLHVKLSLYFDPLRGDSGAIRVLPGTNHYQTPYARNLRSTLRDHRDIERIYGIGCQEIPSYVLETDPGDLVVWNFRTIHASFGGKPRRRLLSINFRDASDP